MAQTSEPKSIFEMIFGLGNQSDDVSRINNLFFPMFSGALIAAIWVGVTAGAVGPVLLWVFASLTAGGTLGFLFGIPKSGRASENDATHAAADGKPTDVKPDAVGASGKKSASPRSRPNTNLEEVSDWLTKIIVGLTLVHLQDLRKQLACICQNAAAAIRQHPTDADFSIATALIVGFALLGFLAGYLYMRLFVQGAIKRSDDDMQLDQYKNALARAEQIGAAEPKQKLDPENPVAVVPSAASVSAAQEVAAAVPPNRPDLVLQPLRQLAREYEELRKLKDYSPERTRTMTNIVRQMRPHALAAAPYICELIESTSTGERLAATVILQMKYMPEHMQWLADRLVEERAFIGYQAASALYARVRLAGVAECKKIQDAAKAAQEARKNTGIQEDTLDKLIDDIINAR